MKLHAAEVDIDTRLVEALIGGRIEGEVREVRSTGTVNAIYRVGAEHYVRLPRVDDRDLRKEWEWLPRLAPVLPLRVPAPVFLGEPAHGYPLHWAVYEWIEGEPFHDGVDEPRAARELAAFVLALRALDPEAAPPTGRAPLAELDQITREAIEAPAVLAAWEACLEAPEWDGEPTWIHCDLLRPNVLVRDRRLAAVIDFGAVGAGDPATDLTAAWALFGPDRARRLPRGAGRRRRRHLGARARDRAAPGGDDHPVLRGDQPGLRRARPAHAGPDPPLAVESGGWISLHAVLAVFGGGTALTFTLSTTTP